MSDLGQRIMAALDCAAAISDEMAHHHLWVIRGIMDDIDPDADLSATELLVLLSVLAPVHTRVLARRATVDITGPFPSTLSVVR